MHPSPVWVSALFWWWWSFPGNGCWLMIALLAHYTTISLKQYLFPNKYLHMATHINTNTWKMD